MPNRLLWGQGSRAVEDHYIFACARQEQLCSSLQLFSSRHALIAGDQSFKLKPPRVSCFMLLLQLIVSVAVLSAFVP